MSETLFDLPAGTTLAPVDVTKLSAGRRLTLRQKRDIGVGRHPLTAGPLHVEPGRQCGNCFFRQLIQHRSRNYPKCWAWPNLVTRGPASDIRAWWPGCTAHEWGDPRLSPDAARSGPPS